MYKILQTFRALISSRQQTVPVKTVLVLTCLLVLGLCKPLISFSQSYQQISLTGFNHDLVANVSNLPASSSTTAKMDREGNVMYVKGYQCSPSSNLRYGLPVNGSITSAVNAALTYQLQPYTQNNALFLTYGSGTLTFGTSGSYDLISILATSSESSSSFSATLNFSDGTSTSYSFYVPDWYHGNPYAFTNFGRVRYAFCGTDETPGNPRFYDNVITLNAADKQKLLKSVTFNKSGSGYTSIFAITGRTVVNAPSIPLNPFANNISSAGFTANWSAVSGATAYKLDVSTNANFSTFVSGYNNADVGNVTALNVPATAGTYYFRVRAVNAAGQSLSSSTTSAVVPSACNAPVISSCPQTHYEQIYSDASSCSKVFTYNPEISGTNPQVSYAFTGATTGSGSGTGSGSAFNVGQTTVTITASNDCGTTSCRFVVTVIDDVPPVVKTKNIKVYLNAAGIASISPQDINDGSFDNCGPVALSFNSGTICGVGAENQNVTLTAPAGEKITGIAFASYGTPVGNCGNYSLGFCHAPNSVLQVSPYLIGKNSGTVPATNAVFGDPCSGTVKRLFIQATYGATSSQSYTFDCSKLGDNQVTLLVTDVNGKVSSQTATVTVVDNIAPTIAKPLPVVVGNDKGKCGAVVSLAIPAASDNCSVAAVTHDAPAIFPVGTTTVTWTVTDASGLSATTTQEVRVNDTEAPVATLAALAPVTGACSATVSAPTAADNCSGEITATTADPTTYTAQGTYAITWTYTDAAGNTATQTQQVIVKDVTAPSIASASAVSVTADAGVCGAALALSVPATSDNCGVQSVTHDAPSVFPVGTTTVTWTVRDVNGLTATTEQTVTVRDNQAPAFAASPDIAVNADKDVCGAAVNYVTPVGTDNCAVTTVQTAGLASGAVFPVGTTTNTFVATDASGNKATTSFTVTVTDKQAPDAFAKNIELALANGSAIITPQMLDAGSKDACGIKSLALSKTRFDCSDVDANAASKDHIVTLTVTDNNGNVSATTAVVTVKGTKPVPAIAVSRTDLTNTGFGTANTVFLGYGAQSLTLTASNATSAAAATTYSWSPAQGLSSTASASPVFTPTAAGTYTYTVTAINEFGCQATATVTLTVVDARCASGNSGKLDKVLVCHKGQPICISPNAVPAHLAHGCSIGNCSPTARPKARMARDGQTADQADLAVMDLTVYPNPVQKRATVAFTLVSQTSYRVEVYDMKGTLVKVVGQGQGEANKFFSLDLDAAELPAGVYLVKLATDTAVFTKRVSILK